MTTLIRTLSTCISFFCLTQWTYAKPNIIILFTDDQRYDTINALGNPHIHTPNLDKLARRSLVFTNAYCYGAHTGAVCIASRNQLMTGNTWHRWSGKTHHPSTMENLPRVMKQAGYQTFYREKSGRANHPTLLKEFDDFADIHNVKALMTGRACQPFVDQAITFLESKRDPNKPFLMYLGLAGPHDPRFAQQQFRDLYKLDEIPLPKNFRPQHHWDIGSMTIRDECLEAWPRTPQATREHILDYYALVSAMDYDIGRLLDYLDAKKLTENTIILFSSDHGLALGSHGLFGKQNTYEIGMKVPFFISGPGIAHGETQTLTYLHDIFPTLADFAGAKLTEPHDGISHKGTICGDQPKQTRPYLTLAYQRSQRSIRDSRWKLMVFPEINQHQLFDLENDPDEIHNLADKHPEIVARLWKQLESEQQRYGDDQALSTSSPKPKHFLPPTNAKIKPRHKVGGAVPTQP
ncbi:sulfatase-like hydrolase/transferase [Rubritalea tangerina]|uniref:Sulfatase-like hydrolase/transferase n=2 Tax=Rubritalea tangerina TaxID=430798 RepID=A0ABW4Z8F2_9BACT